MEVLVEQQGGDRTGGSGQGAAQGGGGQTELLGSGQAWVGGMVIACLLRQGG